MIFSIKRETTAMPVYQGLLSSPGGESNQEKYSGWIITTVWKTFCGFKVSPIFAYALRPNLLGVPKFRLMYEKR